MLITAAKIADWMRWLGYVDQVPTRNKDAALIYLEGVEPEMALASGGKVWAGGNPGVSGDMWDGSGLDSINIKDVSNTVDIANDTGILLYHDGFALKMAVFLGSCDAGSKLSRASGWPKIADGMHKYRPSTYKSGTKKCLRATQNGDNRVLRESPSGGKGGDGIITLDEVIDRGIVYNTSILCHPMWSGPAAASAGCFGPTGGRTDPPYLSIHAHGGNAADGRLGYLPVLFHDGFDFLRHLSPGSSARPPNIRAGSDSPAWVPLLHEKLGLTVGTDDGVFGIETAKALRIFRGGGPGGSRSVTDEDWGRLV